MNRDLTVGRPETVLLRFTLPLLGSILFQQLYNIADSLVAGKYIGDNALAAVGNSYEITLIFLAFAFGCNVGCSVITARLFGAKQYVPLKTAVTTTFISTAVLCGALMLAGFLFGAPLLRVIKTDPVIFDDSLLYLNIYILGLPFLFFYNISTGIFSALGDSRTPFWFLAVSSVTNIFVDILFVRAFNMGVAGVAWATFLCQGASCLLAVVFVVRKLRALAAPKAPLFSGRLLAQIARIAVPSTLQQSFISIGNILIQGIINGYGATATAGYAAAVKLNNLVVTSLTTIGNGMSNFTAQNLGANKPERVKQGFRGGVLMVATLGAALSGVYLLFGEVLLRQFTDSATSGSIAIGMEFLRIVAPFYLLIASKLISDGVLRGSGQMTPFMVGTCADLAIRVIFAYLLSPVYGTKGIWLSWPIGWVVGTALSLFAYFSGCWRKGVQKPERG